MHALYATELRNTAEKNKKYYRKMKSGVFRQVSRYNTKMMDAILPHKENQSSVPVIFIKKL